ncbi:hypothetical protein V5O48_001262 [Marasmius crinis-equi]|uniref:Uncharacterized protein n=1 Tax=Marasmius crinis-equi TaxID=585013 RepID=A0ABR3FZC1_9AGAR
MTTGTGTVQISFRIFFTLHLHLQGRPTLGRQDVSSDNLLSYYSSPLADNPHSSPIPITRQSSADSNSDYSNFSYRSDSTPSDYSIKDESAVVGGSPSVTRRTSRSSKGAADRRRLAIVQVFDSNSQSMSSTSTAAPSQSSTTPSDLRTRRGAEGSLALVAPPDFSPSSYMSDDTPVPPFTAPADSLYNPMHTARPKHESTPIPKSVQGHQRSASEVTTGKRDIAIIGTLTSAHAPSRSTTSFTPPSFDNGVKSKLKPSNTLTLESTSDVELSQPALHPPPLFVRPQSRSPSPGAQSVSSHSDFPDTPDIGEGKAIDVPVASPVVVMTNVVIPSHTTASVSSLSASAHPYATNSTSPADNATTKTSSLSTSTFPHSSHSTTPSINTSTTTTASTPSSAVIPPSAQTPQKQRTTPSIVVVPNTPKSPVSRSTPYTPKSPSSSSSSMTSITSSGAFSPDNLASYRNYLPGVHSTAGPLPPPPRASFVVNTGGSTPPPRPPRQVRSPSPTKSSSGRSSSPAKGSVSGLTATVLSGERGRQRSKSKEDMRENLKLPADVTAALSSRLAPVTKAKSNSSTTSSVTGGGSGSANAGTSVVPGADEKSLNARSDDNDRSTSASPLTTMSPSTSTEGPATKSVHTREPAFSPSTIISPTTTTSTTATTSSTPSIYPETSSMGAHTTTTNTHPIPERRRKVASSSSYEEYTLAEEESEYDTCGRTIDDGQDKNTSNSPHPVIKPPPRGQSLAVSHAMGISGLPRLSVEEEGWVLADNASGVAGNGKRSLEGIPRTPPREKFQERHSFDSPSSSNESEGPSPPPKSFRNSFTKGLKRLSLNASPRRSTSLSSRSTHSRTPSQGSSTLPPLPDNELSYSGRRSLSPSPSPQAFPPRSLSPLNPNAQLPSPNMPTLPLGPSAQHNYHYTRAHPHAHKRIINPSPAALFCSEVYSAPKKSSTSAERCAIYARKLNELYMYDCGLGDWIVGVGVVRGPPQNGVSTISFTDTPRKTSHGSTMSEATFPRRPDASTATDLMIPPTISAASSPSALSPVPPAPRLPYPSLATKSNSGDKIGLLGSLTTPTSGRGAGGFFASLGRKASISRNRGGSSDSGHSTGKTRLTKPPPSSSATVHGNAISSPVLINTSQSVPGGPRALPGRAKTLMISPNPSPSRDYFNSGSTSGSESASGTVGRRPSMYNLGSSPSMSESGHGIIRGERRDAEKENDPVFASQLNRLTDLLPHAERDVLAGYLRRAGQDILAIGQYLDDEKNGCVRRD